MIALIAFYLFAVVTIASAVLVIFSRNPVHSVLLLILAFFNAAGLMLIAGAEFIALLLVIVYVGAVAVLFLFVVMMLDIDLVPLREGFVRAMPVGLVVAVVMLVEMLTLIGVRTMQIPAPAEPAAAAGMSNTTWLATALFSQFLLPFEVAALILTVAIVAAIPLTLRRRVGVKAQNPAKQVMVTARERIRIVKMAAEKPADTGAAP